VRGKFSRAFFLDLPERPSWIAQIKPGAAWAAVQKAASGRILHEFAYRLSPLVGSRWFLKHCNGLDPREYPSDPFPEVIPMAVDARSRVHSGRQACSVTVRSVLAFVLLLAGTLAVSACEKGSGAPSATPASNPAPSTSVAPSQQAEAPRQADAAPQAAADATVEDVDGPPPLRVEPDVLDFGIVPPSVTKEGVVKLVNTGNKELEILTVQPSCKCTTLEDMSGRKIPAGGSIELRANMKAQSAPGRKGAEIKVLVDGYTQVVTVQLKQEVSLPVRVSPSYLNVVKGQPTTGRTIIESVDKQPFKVCAVGGRRPNLVGFDPEKDPPRNQYILDWDFERDFAPGEAKRYWLIETDREDCPLVDIFVRHESTVTLPRGLVPSDYRHTFGRKEQGSSIDFVLDVTKVSAVEKIVAAASESSAVKVELIGSSTEGEVTHINLRVVPNADLLGLAWVPFKVYTSTGRQIEQAVWGQFVPQRHVGCFGR